MELTVRNVTFGDGVLICAPITAENENAICDDVKQIMNNPVDVIEWRCDYYAYCQNIDKITETLGMIRNITDMPIIFTYRTRAEGGEENLIDKDVITKAKYIEMIKKLADTGLADIIDVQTEYLGELAKDVINYAKKMNICVIASNHHFDITPENDEMSKIFARMNNAGADILKMAVMPMCEKDVIRFMDFTYDMVNTCNKPVVTMSMGKLGMITRIAGTLTGSAMTFASVTGASAPGQIPAHTMKTLLELTGANNIKKTCNIFLIGFMGCGKSTIAKSLLDKTGKKVIDSDSFIEQEENMTISEMFDMYGEEFFRKKETSFLENLDINESCIIACGGGMAIRKENVKLMKSKGIVIMLDASCETIYDRVKDDDKRPLLKNNMNTEYIKQLMDTRIQHYVSAADYIVATDGKTPECIADEIVKHLNNLK